MKLIVAIVDIVLVFSLWNRPVLAAELQYRVFYIPLEVDFYSPVLRADMPSHSLEFDLNSSSIDQLFRYISSNLNDFRQKASMSLLRIVVIEKSTQSEFYISQDKKVIFAGYETDYPLGKIDKILDNLRSACKEALKKKSRKSAAKHGHLSC